MKWASVALMLVASSAVPAENATFSIGTSTETKKADVKAFADTPGVTCVNSPGNGTICRTASGAILPQGPYGPTR